jgi:hypothetical protein
MLNTSLRKAVAIAAMTLFASAAQAVIVTGNGVTGVSFSADITQAGDVLTIELDNTTPSPFTGTITGFAFDLSAGGSVLSFSSPDYPAFSLLAGPVAVPPPGGDVRDTGASTGASFNGGNVAGGIDETDPSGTFIFTLSPGATYDGGFVVRFQAVNGDLSDKVDECVANCPPVPGIPEPETYALMLAGLGVIGYMARRRKGPAA